MPVNNEKDEKPEGEPNLDQVRTAEDSNAKQSPPADTEEYDRKQDDAKAA